MEDMKKKVVYWITGSQTLYGADVLEHVAQHSEEMVEYVNKYMPVTVKYLTTCKSSDEIEAAVAKVNGRWRSTTRCRSIFWRCTRAS